MIRTEYIDAGSGHVPPPILKRHSPLGRAVRVEEVEATVRHLVGPDGSYDGYDRPCKWGLVYKQRLIETLSGIINHKAPGNYPPIFLMQLPEKPVRLHSIFEAP